MAEQLELLPAPPRLTERQARALAIISAEGPIPSADLGARFHRHGPDRSCQWCTSTGAELGRALRRKGLARQQRGTGWVPAHGTDTPDPDASFGAFPEGY